MMPTWCSVSDRRTDRPDPHLERRTKRARVPDLSREAATAATLTPIPGTSSRPLSSRRGGQHQRHRELRHGHPDDRRRLQAFHDGAAALLPQSLRVDQALVTLPARADERSARV